MYAFIDESGIQFQTGHSVFTIAFVVSHQLESIDRSLVLIERQLAVSSLHWSRLSWQVRQKLFTQLADLPFSYQIVIVPNPLATTEAALGIGLAQALAGSQLTSIVIDGTWSTAQISRIKKQLRAHSVTVANLRAGNDKAFPGLRIADALAGLHRHLLDKASPQANTLLALIAHKQKMPPLRMASAPDSL
jgi:hypothetical protein